MRIAVFSDIHSNYIALQACLDLVDSLDVDCLFYLGDYVSDFPYPQRVTEIMKRYDTKYKSYYIKGNREEYFIDYHDRQDKHWEYGTRYGSLLYTYENLSQDDITKFRGMDIVQVVEFEDCDSITLCHGSPFEARGIMKPYLSDAKDNTNEILEKINTKYLVCGHTHQQFRYNYKDKVMINPGSVGVQCNGQINAQFALLEWNVHSKKWKCEFVSVPYDIQRVDKDFYESGLVEKANLWAKSMIKLMNTGVNYPMQQIILAEKLYKKSHNYQHNVPAPEEFWKQAAEDLGII